MTTIKVSEILGTKTITSRKNGQQYQVITFKDAKGTVMDTFSKIEEGKEYEGEVTSNQYGISFRVTPKSQVANVKVEELLAEILEINKQILAKIGQTSKSEVNEQEIPDDEEPPLPDEEYDNIS